MGLAWLLCVVVDDATLVFRVVVVVVQPRLISPNLRADCPVARPLGVRQMPQTCALVSTSGGLLAERHGRAIDAATIVARIGSAPLSKELEPHVGRRTTVRLIPTSFFTTSSGRTNHSHRIGAKMNHTHMHGVIADMEPDAEVVFMVRLLAALALCLQRRARLSRRCVEDICQPL